MVYMVVEHFKNGDARPVYRRFQEKGRLAPAGLTYLTSWVEENLQQCFQLMETNDHALLDEWLAQWRDLVDFEVFPVLTSQEALSKITPYL